MKEIWAAEAIVVVFLVLPLFRPFFKALRPLDGLEWLPLIALCITAAIFPAYGFRPECLPMLFAALVVNVVRFIPRRDSSRHSRPPLLTALWLVLVTAAAIPMFAFSPRAYAASEEPPPPRALSIASAEGEYVLRVYGSVRPGSVSPIIFLVPPELGSASADLVCRELWENGFTVVTYSRRDFDIPHIGEAGNRRTVSPFALPGRWHIFRQAADRYSANERGKALEAQRRSDIEYLLPRLHVMLGVTSHGDLPPLLLAGYGAGGSALAYLAGEPGFASRYVRVMGAAAIESRLWSAYQRKDPYVPDIPPSTGMIRRQALLIGGRLRNMGPQRVIRTGPLPGTGLPVMYLVSGRALDASRGQKPYQAVYEAMRSGSGPAILAAIESAGPLDYQDYPYTHPLYSLLMPGLRSAKKSDNPVSDTAVVIGNFTVYLLERTRQAEIGSPSRRAIDGSLAVESKGLPGFP